MAAARFTDGYLLGSYCIATAPEPNSTRFTSCKPTCCLDSGAEQRPAREPGMLHELVLVDQSQLRQRPWELQSSHEQSVALPTITTNASFCVGFKMRVTYKNSATATAMFERRPTAKRGSDPGHGRRANRTETEAPRGSRTRHRAIRSRTSSHPRPTPGTTRSCTGGERRPRRGLGVGLGRCDGDRSIRDGTAQSGDGTSMTHPRVGGPARPHMKPIVATVRRYTFRSRCGR